MATFDKAFNVKNGISVANTIVLDPNRNLLNIANANINGNVFVDPGNIIGPNTGITTTGDITVSRAGQSNEHRGAIYLGRSGSTYLYYDGTQYILGAVTNTSPLVVRGTVTAAGVDLLDSANSAANTVRVSANGGSTLSKQQLNFNNTSTINVSVGAGVSGNANIQFSVNTSAVTGGSGSPGGSNTQIQYNNNGSFGGDPNFTWNATSDLVSVQGNVRISNANGLYFGGEHSNTVANSKFYITWNASSSSLDFVYQ